MVEAHEREGSNGFSGEQIDKYLQQIDKADDKLLSLKSAHMEACKGPRQRIREVMETAKGAGINMAALRTIVAKHRAERKMEQRIAELEADDAADYEAMLEALGSFGDTDLGAAALKNAKPKGGDKLDALHA